MADQGTTMIEVVIAITVSTVAGLSSFGALHTLAFTTASAHQRSQAAVALVSAWAHLHHPCSSSTVSGVSITVLDPCSGPGPHRVRLATGPEPGHRHLTVITDGGP